MTRQLQLEVSCNLDYRMRLGGCRWHRELCTRVTCHEDNLQKRKEKGDEEETEREMPFVTPVEA